MRKIIDVKPKEVREWLRNHPDWEFCGKVNKISHAEIFDFVNTLYKFGCKSILISDYEWEIEPVYEGDEFHPNMLVVTLPVESLERQKTIDTINESFSKLTARTKYQDTGIGWLWYFFEPEPETIKVGKKEISWYT